MERGFFLWFAAVMVSVAPGVKGSGHLSFANNTQVNITRAGCGASKLCLETPTDCDPAGNATCLFGSVVLADLSIQLRGESAGYIALGINASERTTRLFICARNVSGDGKFFFRTMQIDTNNQLTPQETRVTEIRGLVNGDVIQCEFDIPDVNAVVRNSFKTLTYLLGTGSFNGTTFGMFNISLSMSQNITVNITAGASSVLHSYALPLLLSVVTLSVTQRA